MQPELTSSEIEMLSFDCADDRITAYLHWRAAVAPTSDDEAQDEKLTSSELEMLMLDKVDDRIAAYEKHRMIAAYVDKTTATETTVDNDNTKSAVDTMGQGAPGQKLPSTSTYNGPRRVFCQEIPCVSVWERKSIEGTVYVLSRPNARDYTVCASCYAAYKHTCAPDELFITKAADEYPPLVKTSRQRLQKYESTSHRWRTDGPWILGLLALLPIAMPFFYLLSACGTSPSSLHWTLGRPLAIWRSLCKMHLLVFGAYLMVVVVLLVFTCPFTSQVIFWTLLEIYTLAFFAIGLVYQSTAPGLSPLKTFLGRRSALQIVQNELNRASHAFVVAFAAEAKNIDVTNLNFVAKDGSPVPPTHVAAAFEANRVSSYVQRRLTVPMQAVAVFAAVVALTNEFLVVSWATGAVPSSVWLPGINGLVTSPKQTTYNVHYTDAMCTPLSPTTSDVLFNVVVAPAPRGNPLLTFGFSSVYESVEFNTSFELLASWDIDIKSTHARNVTIGLYDDQSALTFRVWFPLTCSDVQKLAIDYLLTFETVSLNSMTDYLSAIVSTWMGMGLVQIVLVGKYLVQLVSVTKALWKSSFKIWSLWLRFDTICKSGFDLPGNGPTAIALTDGENLHAWFTLRNGVRAATSMNTCVISGFICAALLQFGCTVAGILFYCISGSAPLPTYFLLVIGLLGSLSTLAMLVPLAAALDIQRNHSVMLRKHLLELEFQRRKAQLQDDATTLDERIAMFETVIDAIEHHDDRLAFFGIEISLARLATLSATLVSLLSFVVFRAVPITWSDLNSFNIVRPEMYNNALNPLVNTPKMIKVLQYNRYNKRG